VKIIFKVFRLLLIIYLICADAFFYLSSFISFSVFLTKQLPPFSLFVAINTLVWALLITYILILVLHKDRRQYKMVLIAFVVILFITTLHRLFFISNFQLTNVDLNNTLLFGIPILLSGLTSGFQKRFNTQI
jgi:hypothetical protein